MLLCFAALCCAAANLQAASAALTDQWYPPVRGTLLLLSKLYRCVDMRIFAGLAQEAVAACTVSVQVGTATAGAAACALLGCAEHCLLFSPAGGQMCGCLCRESAALLSNLAIAPSPDKGPALTLPSLPGRPFVQAAGRQVAKSSSPLDGQLFVIQHLLFLREQIAHFDVDLTVTDIDLDFSHMRDHVRRIMTGEQ